MVTILLPALALAIAVPFAAPPMAIETSLPRGATEVWIYPLGWSLFFSGQRLVDITQYVAPPK